MRSVPRQWSPDVPWWVHWEGRFERELASLDDRGFAHDGGCEPSSRRDGDGIEAVPVMVVMTTPTICTVPLELRVTYPDTYPYFRFAAASTLDLPRHQHPFEDVLCLLDAWSPELTVGEVLETQIPKLLVANERHPDVCRCELSRRVASADGADDARP